MQFKIEISYEDKQDGLKPDFELNVKSEFSDDAAKLVGETLAKFYEKFTETKNNARYVKTK